MSQAVTKLADGFATQLLQLGVTGLFICILLYAVWRLAKLYIGAQEARIRESVPTTSALVASSTVLNRVAAILEAQRKT